MLQNFFMIAWRNLIRQKGYAFLNILGLTLGISAAVFILLFLTQELSYDQHHSRAERIFRIASHIEEPDNAFRWVSTQLPLGPTLQEDYPEVEAFTRMSEQDRFFLEYEDETFVEQNVYFADSAIFQLFSFELLHGDPMTALTRPNSIALNQTLAQKLFGTEPPLGKLIKNADGESLEVTAVYQDWPTTSHIIPHALLSVPARMGQSTNWGGFGIFTYVMLREGSSQEEFAAKLPEVVEKYVDVIFKQFDITVKYVLQPIRDIHLKSTEQGEPEPTGNMYYIYTFLAIAGFLLLIACINYMNLATARSARRAREVGLRKVLGSWRSHLIGQFLTESLLMASLSILLSVGLVLALLPLFNLLLAKPILASSLFSPMILGSLGGMLLLVGLLSGSYPAFYLSSFQPVEVIKGTFKGKGGHAWLRKILVVTQFSISLAMLVCTGVVLDQLNYLQAKDLGFTSDPMLRFRLEEQSMREKWPSLRNELLQFSGITAAATSNSSPGKGYGKELMRVENKQGVMEEKGVDNYAFDHDFMATMNLDLVQGRGFSEGMGTDSAMAVLVNEAMVARMAWEDPIGKEIELSIGDSVPTARVVGVVGNFHQKSLYEIISPLMFLYRENNYFGHVRIEVAQVESALAHIQASWERVFPNVPFEYEFLSESFQEQYEADQLRSRVFTIFSLLTVLIACLGLLGLAAFTAEQRTKEIGIRKVVGASNSQLMMLLIREYLVLVGVAIPFAFIPAYFYLEGGKIGLLNLEWEGWLDSFAYATSINPLIFVGAIFLTLLVTVATVSFHAWKAANSDPIGALRHE